MSDELFKILATIIGTLLTVLVSYATNTMNKIGVQQNNQALQLAEMKGLIGALQQSVGSIHNWRNRMQEKEFTDMEAQIKEYKAKLGETV